MTLDPVGRASPLEHRRNVGVYDDVSHGRSAHGSVTACAEIGEESIKLLVGLPDVGGKLLEIVDRPRMLVARKLFDRCRRP